MSLGRVYYSPVLKAVITSVTYLAVHVYPLSAGTEFSGHFVHTPDCNARYSSLAQHVLATVARVFTPPSSLVSIDERGLAAATRTSVTSANRLKSTVAAVALAAVASGRTSRNWVLLKSTSARRSQLESSVGSKRGESQPFPA
jgi:hypothetical protein